MFSHFSKIKVKDRSSQCASQTDDSNYHVSTVLFCSLAVLDPRVGMDVLSPFISVLCHSDWLFHRESCPHLDAVSTVSESQTVQVSTSLHQSLQSENSLDWQCPETSAIRYIKQQEKSSNCAHKESTSSKSLNSKWRWIIYRPHTHTHTRLTAHFPGLPGSAGTRKVKPIWISLKQQTVTGSGISWAIWKSAPCSRQITMPAPNHSVFLQTGCPSCRPSPTVSKHWRHRIIYSPFNGKKLPRQILCKNTQHEQKRSTETKQTQMYLQ